MIKQILLFLVSYLIAEECCFAQEMLSNPRCNHYPERGTCEISFEVKWYYDRFDHRCRRFFYGGCEGNENRFDSLIECEQSCHFDPQIDETSSRRCFQSHDPGSCWGNFERWYFDSNLKRCVCSWWSGCGGNSNRFYSYPHCMQICGEHAVEGQNNQDIPAPDDTVYESPMQRLSMPIQFPPPPLPHKPATQVYARPRDTQPLGGGMLYPSHVSTPQHPPIYDDPDLFKIQPVFETDDAEDDEDSFDDENVEEFETTAFRNPLSPQEWSAKTETRFFPNLGLRNRTFSTPKPLTSTSEPNSMQAITTPSPVKISSSSSSIPISDEDETDDGMLLNLQPPAEFQSKTKKRNVEAEVVETNFRTTRQQARRSSGTPEVEEYETNFQKQTSAGKQENYEKYDTPHDKGNVPQSPPQLGYAQAASRNPRTRYHEEAETQFLRHSYINPPMFPGFPILKSLNSEGRRVPQPVPQGLINQLIAQHLALRERLGQTQKVPVIQVERNLTAKHSVEIRETPYRRMAGRIQTEEETARAMSYAEKRRRWKEEMKKKLKKQKIPPRQLVVRPIITGEKNKYYVTYSPYYRLYQVSRQAPKGINLTTNESPLNTADPTTTMASVEVISPQPPLFTTTTTTIYPSTTTSTTTPAPKVVSLKAEPLQPAGNKMQIRVAAIKPTSKINGKQLLYMDDEDEEWKVEEEDYYVDENGKAIEKPKTEEETPTSTSIPLITTPSDNGLAAIVFPVDHNPEQISTTVPPVASTRKSVEQASPGADYILPPEPSATGKQDYFDYGHSEEDLFFWKPEFEQRPRTRVDPTSQNGATTESFNDELPPASNDDDAFEITVHNPNKKL